MKYTSKPICIGTGLIALDVIISSISNTPIQFLVGGSCGNVNTILSYLGWSAHPIARLSKNVASELLLKDLRDWNVNEDLLSVSDDGSTPIIIHRILKDLTGAPKHRFEFRNPEDGKYLPSYKPCLAKSVENIFSKLENPNVFYFDRINRASIKLAKLYKSRGAVIFFEPSSAKDEKGFKECVDVADVLKFSNDRIANYEQLFSSCKVELEVQTMGSDGLKFRRKKQHKWTQVSGYSISNVVDAAGAGDWCTAGIINTLFDKKVDFKSIKESQIIAAMEFGQSLSAMNCTFEGARGLMYNVANADLISYINEIFLSDHSGLNLDSKIPTVYQVQKTNRKISSLFETAK